MTSIDLQKLQNLLYVLNAQPKPEPATYSRPKTKPEPATYSRPKTKPEPATYSRPKTKPEQEYDPEDWSIVSREERRRVEEIIHKMKAEDISIGRVLAAANLPNTPSRYTWVRYIMFRKI